MQKIFSTQLNGIFTKIQQESEYAIEDAARLLAQTLMSRGTVYFATKSEMKAIAAEGMNGPEAFPAAKELSDSDIPMLTSTDIVIAANGFLDDEGLPGLARKVKDQTETPVILITSLNEEGESQAVEWDAFIRLPLRGGLVPFENGERYGIPSAMAGLFAFHVICLTAKEILEEYE
ncbi:protein of unknown function [Fictibacillus solisalsi]|uniref:DUF2529 domain-containing protein n=1 Tax=Fictibacillus solisalsi TaxID=459525 RepID=A0A1H0B763_9BACL|nr:DUF2529 family protein [Fictibacillus solisalsi]SDN41456.1 protein of unknown function [Fictibacillus solisalsi]